MKSIVLALASAFAFAPVAFAAPPDAPTITVAATDIKQLEFNITPVTRVNWYELWFKANAGAPWVYYARTPAQRPLFRINTSVHLLDWRQARYLVKACNPSVCSQSNEVGVDGEQLAAMGYIKPNRPTGQLFFGTSIALSADGKTLAVLAAAQLGGYERSAVVYVYRKTTSTSGWRREAQLLPSTVQSNTVTFFAGDSIALSGDGNLLVFGNWLERRGNNSADIPGAVYLFRRTGSTWALGQKLMTEARTSDFFGKIVKVDDAGRTLVIARSFPT